MDTFSIERGTLLDNPSVISLVNPELHSYHCLLDVDACIRSGYEVLIDPPRPPSSSLSLSSSLLSQQQHQQQQYYSRGIRLDDNGNKQILSMARSTGHHGLCSTCTNTTEGSPTRGFRATVNGTVTSLGGDHDGTTSTTTTTPITIETVSIRESSVGCGDYVFVPPSYYYIGGNTTNGNDIDNDNNDSYRSKVLWHGSLMIVSWGWMLPSGVMVARLRDRLGGDDVWFKIHRILQLIGMLIALIGWIIALVNFNVFSSGSGKAYTHGVMGVMVMTMGLMQPLNAFLRPHPTTTAAAAAATTTTTATKSLARVQWEIAHKGLGYIAILLAVATIILGTMLVPEPSDQHKFQLGYGIGAVGALVILVVGMNCSDTRKKPLVERRDNSRDMFGPLLGEPLLGNENVIPV